MTDGLELDMESTIFVADSVDGPDIEVEVEDGAADDDDHPQFPNSG